MWESSFHPLRLKIATLAPEDQWKAVDLPEARVTQVAERIPSPWYYPREVTATGSGVLQLRVVFRPDPNKREVYSSQIFMSRREATHL